MKSLISSSLLNVLSWIVLTWIALPSDASGLQLKVSHHNLSIMARITDYPVELLTQEIKSGLPNQLDVRLLIANKQGTIKESVVSYIIRFDLWDENYWIKQLVDNGNRPSEMMSEAELLSFMGHFRLTDVLDIKSFSKTEELTVAIKVLFNPVSQEKISQISKWIRTSNGFDPDIADKTNQTTAEIAGIAANQASISTSVNALSTGGLGANLQSKASGSSPRFQKLFDKLLEQNMSDDSIAAQWKSETLVTVFTLQSLIGEHQKN